MNNKKRTIFISVLVILFTFFLCVGTTLAFFTDSFFSKNNKVQAGRLKIDLELLQKNTTDEWISIKSNSAPIFSGDILWEGGYTDVKVLRIQNEGDIAAQWKALYGSKK